MLGVGLYHARMLGVGLYDALGVGLNIDGQTLKRRGGRRHNTPCILASAIITQAFAMHLQVRGIARFF